MRIARVFPTKTSMSPTDPLAFFGAPTLDAIAAEPDEVHISVTFSWDLEKADELFYQWEMLGVPVEVGGPAFGDRMSETFTPGMYLKEGMTITSRGCPKDCWFCDVGKCARGRVIELPVQDGWDVLDDNILATSDTHFAEVISMLKRQKRRPVFSGGLEPEYMALWKAEQIMSVKPKTIYTAYDTLDDYEHLREMSNMLHNAGLSWKSHVSGGKIVVGEFACDNIATYNYDYCTHPEIGMDYDCGDSWWEIDDEDLESACLTEKEFRYYAFGREAMYGWHISDLKIYDTPKELPQFRKCCGTQDCDKCQFWENTGEYAGCLTSEERRLNRAPQSWCYVEELE